MKINNTNNMGSGCLTVFGLCFLIPGLIVGFFALKNLTSSLQASSWQSIDATILSAELESKRSNNSTTYRAIGKFSYRYAGTEYSSDKLHFGSGNDNIGSFHQDLVRDMKISKANNQTMQAWVNPKNPSQAVLIKDVRWNMFAFMMIFPLIFGGAGIGIIYMGRHAKKQQAIENEYQQLYPQQAWMWKEEWHSNIIKSSNKTTLWFSVIFACFWNLISLPILFIIPEEILGKKNYLALVALLFPLVGMGLAAWAIRNYRQWKKFGASELTLDNMPARLGRIVRAQLHIPAELTDQDKCQISLECVHKYTSGSGKNRSSKESILWQDQQRITVNSANFDGHTIPVEFMLPDNMPATNWENASNQHFWRVRAEADLPGVDYSANFEVPVFAVDQSSLSEEERYEDNFFAELESTESRIDTGDWQHLNLQHEKTIEGSRYTFARARLKSMCFVLSVMALIFLPVGIAMFIVENGSTFLGVIFCIFGFFLGWGALHQWLYKSEFTVAYNSLHLRSGWFMTNTKEFQLADIKRIYKNSSMSSNNVKYYGIYIDTNEKKNIKIAENLVGNRDVDNLIATISDEFGLKN